MICCELVDNASDMIQSIAPDGSFLYVNNSWLTALGYGRQEVQRLKVFDVIHPDDRDHCSEVFHNLMQGEKIEPTEVKFLAKDGRTILLEGNVTCHMEESQPISTFGVFRDITDRKEQETQLKRDAEKIKHFAYAVAHDLKNPAIALHGITRLLHNRYGKMFDDKGKSYCSQVLQSSQLLSELVEKLNVFIETKEFTIDKETVHLNNIFRILREEFQEKLRERHITLQVPDRFPAITGDCLSLLRIFRNLIDNSLKYGGPALDSIDIAFHDSETHHILKFRDNGCGIHADNHQKLFDYFERKKINKSISGAGLGLAIVKELVEQHGGKVLLESVPGQGTTFTITIAKQL
ncbi:MAG: PAS domain-containing sensor histidine kinase [Thermodesulfobacteriota bacterium]|jgi:PAS domain S-box-containing protein